MNLTEDHREDVRLWLRSLFKPCSIVSRIYALFRRRHTEHLQDRAILLQHPVHPFWWPHLINIRQAFEPSGNVVQCGQSEFPFFVLPLFIGFERLLVADSLQRVRRSDLVSLAASFAWDEWTCSQSPLLENLFSPSIEFSYITQMNWKPSWLVLVI